MAGECHEALQDLDAAVASFRRSLQFRPNEWATLCRLGYCERLRGHAEESVAALQRAAQLRPQSSDTLNELALALLQAQRPAEAVQQLRRAITLDGGSREARRNLAKVLYVLHLEGNDASRPPAGEVAEALERALEHAPGDVEMRHLRDAMRGRSPPRPPEGYVAGFFDRFAPAFEAKLASLRYAAPQVAAELLGPRLAGRSLRIADLGCGTGLAAEFLKPSAARLVGVDLSAGMLEVARARAIYDELAQEDIVAWLERQAPGAIDMALALDVLNYVGHLGPAATACARALAPGGLLAFTIERLDGPGYALRPSGRYAHAPSYVIETCEAAGLRLEESRDLAIREEAGGPVPAVLYAFSRP